MKNILKISVITFLLPIVYLLFLHQNTLLKFVFAQTPAGRGEIELNILEGYEPCENDDITCVPFPAGAVHPDTLKQNYELRLQASALPPNTNIYIVGCVNAIDGRHCTGGSEQVNSYLENTLLIQMNPLPTSGTNAHEFSVGSVVARPQPYNPIRSDVNGRVDVIVRSYTPFQTTHRFFGFFEAPPIPTATPIITQPGSPIYGTDAPSPTPTPAPRPNINMDPKGRVFDSKSLEPIPKTKVTLLNDTRQIYSDQWIINPITTDASGEFNFFVKNGMYYLNTESINRTHLHPLQYDEVDRNYEKAYYCDLDVKDTNGSPAKLYYNQFEIPEYDKLIHCDVPMKPTGSPYIGEVVTINYGYFSHPTQNKIVYSGKVSHPYTIVSLQSAETNKNLTQTTADKFGFWEAEILLNQYPVKSSGLPDDVSVYYTKVSLLSDSMRYSSRKNIELEPIPQYIEGYAVDKNGSIIPNAVISVKKNGTTKPMKIAQADETGYFFVDSNNTPKDPFSIRFSEGSDKESVYYTAREYLELNDDVLITRNVNLLQRNSEGKAKGGYVQNRFQNTNNQNNSNTQENNQSKPSNRPSFPIGLIVISLLIIGMIGIGVYVVIKKKG